eukprot:2071498-Prymnesium_polylepis.1
MPFFKNVSNNCTLYYSDENLGGSGGKPLWRTQTGPPASIRSHSGWYFSVIAGDGPLPPMGKWTKGHMNDHSSNKTYPTLSIEGASLPRLRHRCHRRCQPAYR